MQLQHQLPKDIYFPEIDEATREMIDATDAQARRTQGDKVPAPMPFNAGTDVASSRAARSNATMARPG